MPLDPRPFKEYKTPQPFKTPQVFKQNQCGFVNVNLTPGEGLGDDGSGAPVAQRFYCTFTLDSGHLPASSRVVYNVDSGAVANGDVPLGTEISFDVGLGGGSHSVEAYLADNASVMLDGPLNYQPFTA